MPEYTFQVVIILVKNGDELGLVRESHSLYINHIMDFVYHIAKPYLADGYQLHKYYLQNFNFRPDKIQEHG
jgi:hypothetical protein